MSDYNHLNSYCSECLHNSLINGEGARHVLGLNPVTLEQPLSLCCNRVFYPNQDFAAANILTTKMQVALCAFKQLRNSAEHIENFRAL